MIKKYFLLFLPLHIDKTMVQYFPYLLLLMVAILQHQREILHQLNKNPRIDEEQIRNFHRQLNLEEEKWEVN